MAENVRSLMHQFHSDLSLSILNHFKLLCCTPRKIDNPLIRAMRASLIDLHDNALVVFRFVTLTIVPRGSVLCAAVKASLSYFLAAGDSFSLHCITVENRNACFWCAGSCLRCNRRLSM